MTFFNGRILNNVEDLDRSIDNSTKNPGYCFTEYCLFQKCNFELIWLKTSRARKGGQVRICLRSTCHNTTHNPCIKSFHFQTNNSNVTYLSRL